MLSEAHAEEGHARQRQAQGEGREQEHKRWRTKAPRKRPQHGDPKRAKSTQTSAANNSADTAQGKGTASGSGSRMGSGSESVVALERLALGDKAPLFSLRTLNSKACGRAAFALRDFVGETAPPKSKGVVLSFAASFCEPCRHELSALRDLAPRLAAAGISVAVVVTDTDPEGIAIMEQLTVRELKLPFAVLSDRFGVVGRRYGVSALPMTVLVDRGGDVRWQASGFREESLSELKMALGLVE